MVRVLLEFHGYASPADADGIYTVSQQCLERLRGAGFKFVVDPDPEKTSEEAKYTHATLRFGFAAKVLVTYKGITQSGSNPGVLQDIPTIEDAQVTTDLLNGHQVGDFKHMRTFT
jgi:hypothetical protein